MPEHDTFDLDAAFRALERDVSTLSAAPGAGAAVGRARQRRRRTIGLVAAVAVLVLGGVAVSAGLHGRDSAEPADLPAPATFDAQAFSQATAGWASGWATPTDQDDDAFKGLHFPCRGDFGDNNTIDPAEDGSPVWISSQGELAFGSLDEWSDAHADVPASIYTQGIHILDSCAHATSAATYSYEGAEGRSWTFTPGSTSGSGSDHLWLAQQGRAMAMLWMTGVPDQVPAAVDQRVMDALVAGLQAPDSYRTDGDLSTISGTSTGSGSGDASFNDPDQQQVARAFGTWDSGLTSHGSPQHSIPSTPCTGSSWETESSSSQSTTIGGNGAQTDIDFDSATAAQQAFADLVSGWEQCAKTDYTVSTVDVPGTGTVTVATSQGAHPATNWAIQDGKYVSYLSIDGGNQPPADVSAAVGALLYDVLAHPQSDTGAHDSPKKLKESGAPTGTVGGSSTGTVSGSASAAPKP
jgi:hypothetical protein